MEKNLENISWLDTKVSFYGNGHADTTPGLALSLRQILLTEFVYWLPVIIQLKNLDPDDRDYEQKKRSLKRKLAAYALNGLESRRGKVLYHSGLLQLDWDFGSIKDYDIDELIKAVFDLPFIAFCGKSCTGRGFYAFATIAEPNRLRQYAEHCFLVFDKYGIPVDTSKGRNYNDLRYVSYDCNMMIRDNPVPLKIKRFRNNPIQVSARHFSLRSNAKDRRITKGLDDIRLAQPGRRFDTVRRVAYMTGGIPGTSIDWIIEAIINSSQYDGYEDHCIRCARDAFNAGMKQPIL